MNWPSELVQNEVLCNNMEQTSSTTEHTAGCMTELVVTGRIPSCREAVSLAASAEPHVFVAEKWQ